MAMFSAPRTNRPPAVTSASETASWITTSVGPLTRRDARPAPSRVSVFKSGTSAGRDADHAGNIKAQERMVELAGSVERIVPGHDALQFQKFPSEGRVAKIK